MPCAAATRDETRSTASKPASKLTGFRKSICLFLGSAPAGIVQVDHALVAWELCNMVLLKMPGLNNW
jgi:hypothetical protein